MATSRNDDKGYERGARGIDGRDGEDFHGSYFPSGGGGGLATGQVMSSDKGGLKVKRSGGFVGLLGGLGRYVFCGGIGECARRQDQIARGTLRVQPFPPIKQARQTRAQEVSSR